MVPREGAQEVVLWESLATQDPLAPREFKEKPELKDRMERLDRQAGKVYKAL